MSAMPLPPGPKGSFLLGSLPDFGRDLLGFFSSSARYGDVVRFRLARYPALLLYHPDHVEQVLVTRSRDYAKHSFFFRHVEAIFGNGLLTSEGDFWLRQRRLAQPAFHRERIAGYADTMAACAERQVSGWRGGEVRDVQREMMAITLEIVSRTLFGAQVDQDAAAVGRAFDLVAREIAVRVARPFRIPDGVPTPGNRRYRAGLRQLDHIVYEMIRTRRAQGGGGDDLLSLLLQAQDEDGSRMTDAQLRDEAVTLFLAGHETTALALAWTLFLLARHPEAAARVGAEVDEALGGRRPAMADLPRLAYTEHAIKEAMRLYPPVYAVGREAVRDTEAAGYPVAKGTTVFASQWVIHRDPRFYPDPDTFRPERWASEAARALPKFAYFPFGGGPRLCIGNTFAMMEAVLILAVLAGRFRFELEPGQRVTPFPSITLRPLHGILMRVRNR
ncbi:MAG TPA: cytochrome P450 [Vicinamibacteria bacterium]